MDNVFVYRFDDKVGVPSRNNPIDAGLDLYANEDKTIKVGETGLVSTGVAINVPDGYVGRIAPRSSNSLKGLIIGAGVVDPGYSGNIGVVIHNFSARDQLTSDSYSSEYSIKKGDKIAQILFYKVATPVPYIVEELWVSGRGSKGLGSSGR